MDGNGFSDAARRCSDEIATHVIAGSVGKWAAIRLSDGGSDGVPYDTKADAIRHQLHETLCVYVHIPPDGMSPRAAESYLQTHRLLYDRGYRDTDPDRDVVITEIR